ncbi:MAG TPA: RNA polymerase subunit sigma-70 [Clostridiales bacterium]|nr:RNA polymerase subunit sigma-70 [Clostridiales bacterium]
MTNEEMELLISAKNGNANAINQILIDNKSLVNQIARKYFLLGGDRDDVLQEGMIGLFNAINSYDEKKNDNFKNYASRVVEREIINAIRKENTRKNSVLNSSVITDISDYLHEENYPELDIIAEENNLELLGKINSDLSEFEKTVVKLFLEGYTYLDIAKMLNKKPKTIDNALTRIKSKLRRIKKS